MCGIVGILNRDPRRPVDRALLDRMTDLMAYRGPDERGAHIDGSIGLGHRRLSIIDLAGGQQPMQDARRGRVLTYNGEIYNHRSLRESLGRARSAALRGHSDTGVLLELAELDELGWLERLNGMFAFGLWEAGTHRLLLARDRLGVKPLYYADLGACFVFASEIKPLLVHPGVRRRVNAARVPEYVAFRSIAGDQTLFEGIRQVPPGHAMLLEPPAYRPRLVRYWREGARDPAAWAGAPGQPDAERFAELFRDAVGHRLVSDVPVGTFNSGGVDSSLVTAMVRSMKPGELHTFSVGFAEASHDETRHSQVVARRYGTIHHAIVVGQDDYTRQLRETLWHLEEPINHPHTVQLLLLSHVARQFVTVVLTGEGADEVFGGYPRYNIVKLRGLLRAMPDSGLRWLVRSLERSRNRRAGKLAEGLAQDEAGAAILNARFVPGADLNRLYPAGLGFPERQALYRDRSGGCGSAGDALHRLLRYEQRTYLSSLLARLDKTSMAASVEARVPFLDYRLVEWSYRLRPDAKIRKLSNKWIVRQAARRWLPGGLVDRSKVGFDVPVGQWLRNGQALGQHLELLRDATFRQRGYFDAPTVDRLVDEHLQGRADHTEALWSLLGFEMWHRMFIDADPCAASR